jgi:RNA polymerase sigma-70 factor (ECF subfamily)
LPEAFPTEASVACDAGVVESGERDDVDDATAVDLDGLLAQTATGDQAAFSALYDNTAARVLGLVRRVMIDPAQSEEVTQEVFLEIWQSAPRFDPNKGRASTWIMTMAHRRAIDRIRSAQASRNRDRAVGIRDLPTAYDQVAETVEVRVEHERVEQAMSKLSDAQREAVTLAYFGGYTQSEVAEMLGIPLGTAKTRMRDAMIRLRRELGVTR